MSDLRICKVWDAEYPWDVRVAKVLDALSAAGASVHLVARNRTGKPTRETLSNAVVHRMSPLPIRSLNAASQFPAFFNPRWYQLIRRTVLAERCNLILVRDLPLAPTAIAVARHLGLPVVFDMAENYPAMMAAIFRTGVNRPLDILVRNPRVVAKIERWVLKRVDHTCVVVEESAERLYALGVPRSRVSVVSNTPPLKHLAAAPAERQATPPLRLVYLGLLEAPRGIRVLLEAMALVRDRGVPAHLSVIGSGREAKTFESLAESLQLGPDRVVFEGYLPNERALAHVAAAHVGIVPHLATESWNTTIPNKLFDYMARGLAVLTSDAAPAARIVRETGAGVVYRHADPEDMAQAILQFVDRDRCRDFAVNGRQAVVETYNWERDAERLIEAIRSVADASTSTNHRRSA